MGLRSHAAVQAFRRNDDGRQWRAIHAQQRNQLAVRVGHSNDYGLATPRQFALNGRNRLLSFRTVGADGNLR